MPALLGCAGAIQAARTPLYTPTNIRIIEITPSARASYSGEWLCAHLLLFGKTYHFMKSACISCMILTMALCSPPFPPFLGRKWKWRCSNSGIFWIHPRVPPPAGVFSKFILKSYNVSWNMQKCWVFDLTNHLRIFRLMERLLKMSLYVAKRAAPTMTERFTIAL